MGLPEQPKPLCTGEGICFPSKQAFFCICTQGNSGNKSPKDKKKKKGASGNVSGFHFWMRSCFAAGLPLRGRNAIKGFLRSRKWAFNTSGPFLLVFPEIHMGFRGNLIHK
ncbi:hypothetical protein TNIN_475791 [Trichonephila inaurata madagascariensis]|uniref:Uncharacterized protein n=1 Tax=Trichonephila inaurata madagascariensis TaxID=2747483 RepID=A0A8X6MIP9_9ARAC|nr:hypothetical protein TNIN_475791 [Trichonephila inaurata madagascariensis]